MSQGGPTDILGACKKQALIHKLFFLMRLDKNALLLSP